MAHPDPVISRLEAVSGYLMTVEHSPQPVEQLNWARRFLDEAMEIAEQRYLKNNSDSAKGNDGIS